MMEKRMAKMRLVEQETLEPVVFGEEEPEAVLIGFGSTKGAIRETAEILSGEAVKFKQSTCPKSILYQQVSKRYCTVLEGNL